MKAPGAPKRTVPKKPVQREKEKPAEKTRTFDPEGSVADGERSGVSSQAMRRMQDYLDRPPDAPTLRQSTRQRVEDAEKERQLIKEVHTIFPCITHSQMMLPGSPSSSLEDPSVTLGWPSCPTTRLKGRRSHKQRGHEEVGKRQTQPWGSPWLVEWPRKDVLRKWHSYCWAPFAPPPSV